MNDNIKRILNAQYGIDNKIIGKNVENITFDTVRAILEVLSISIDISDYRVIIFSSVSPLEMNPRKYRDIPDCFNCNVHGFEINLDNKVIFIKREVSDHE